jgi:nucleoside-diphosphate-sugar epimerase
MKSILITGASGFIGQACIRLLANSDYKIYAITRKLDRAPNIKNINWLEADLFKTEEISKLVNKLSPSHLLHLAWITDNDTYQNSDKNIDWLNASKLLIDTFISSGGKRIIAAGSCAEYNWDEKNLIENVSELRAQSVYSQSKIHLYNYLNTVTNNTNVEFSWGRVFFVYGPGEQRAKLISSIIDNIIHKRELNIKHPGYLRDYIYVDDVARIFIKLLSAPYIGPINIGSGEAIAISDIVQLISEILLEPAPILSKHNNNGSNFNSIIKADTNLLKSKLLFETDFNLNSGLINTINYYKEEIGIT